MSNSAFTFKSQTVTTITDNGSCTITQNITQSEAKHQIYDWVETDACVEPGDILYRNPESGIWDKASAATASTAVSVGVVEDFVGCGSARQAKLVYQGRIDFPAAYTVRDGAVYYLSDDSAGTEEGSANIRNGSVNEGTLCRPVYVGVSPRSAIVINHIDCIDIPIPETSPDVRISYVCVGDGMIFTVTNNGDADMTSSVSYTVVGEDSSSTLRSGTISALNQGDSVTIPVTGSLNNPVENTTMTITDGTHSPADPKLQDSETTACSFGTEYINVRVAFSDVGTPEPSATTYFTSDVSEAGSSKTVTFTGFNFTPSGTPNAIFIQESASLAASNASIVVNYDTHSDTYDYYATLGLWTRRNVTNPQASSLVSITLNL